MITIIVVALIAIYSVIIIYKKVKDIKKGKFCSCNCSYCEMANKCENKKKNFFML